MLICYLAFTSKLTQNNFCETCRYNLLSIIIIKTKVFRGWKTISEMGLLELDSLPKQKTKRKKIEKENAMAQIPMLAFVQNIR